MIITNSCSEKDLNFYSLTIGPTENGVVIGDSGNFESGTSITISAIPNEGYGFVRWVGLSETEPQVTINMYKDTYVGAIFAPLSSYNGDNFFKYEVNSELYDSYGSLSDPNMNVISNSVNSYFENIQYLGLENRELLYKNPEEGRERIVLREEIDTHVFNVSFIEGHDIELIIDQKLTLTEAESLSNNLAYKVGQLPNELRKGVYLIWLKKHEVERAAAVGGGVGRGGIILSTSGIEYYESRGIMEELLLHEATHSSAFYFSGFRYEDYEALLDNTNCTLTGYARDFPLGEDLAEAMLYYVAVKYFLNDLPDNYRDIILSCHLDRFEYLDSLNLDMSLYNN